MKGLRRARQGCPTELHAQPWIFLLHKIILPLLYEEELQNLSVEGTETSSGQRWVMKSRESSMVKHVCHPGLQRAEGGIVCLIFKLLQRHMKSKEERVGTSPTRTLIFSLLAHCGVCAKLIQLPEFQFSIYKVKVSIILRIFAVCIRVLNSTAVMVRCWL